MSSPIVNGDAIKPILPNKPRGIRDLAYSAPLIDFGD